MRKCISCCLLLEENNFKKYTRKRCIECYRDYQREYASKNRERIRNRQRKYQNDRIEELRIKRKEYRELNKDKINENYRNFIEKNPKYNTKYSNNRYKNDIMFKLIRNYRNLVSISFMSSKKSLKSKEILGCSFEEFKIYLESKFENWMTWENRGLYNGEFNHGWDIDHIIPISLAKNEDDLIRLNHFTNLQPLCSKVNRDIKRNIINKDS